MWCFFACFPFFVYLNEVLSIRAQESLGIIDITLPDVNLNEVLSIRAQELCVC